VALDRAGRPGRVLAAAMAGYAAGLAAVAVLVAAAPLAAAVVVAAIAGLLAPALAGGWTAQLAAVVPAGRLGRAHALDAATYSAASLAGPALASGTAVAWGAGWAVAAAVAVLLAAVPLAGRLPPRRPRPVPAGPAAPPGRPGPAAGAAPSGRTVAAVGQDLRAGFRAIGRVPGLRAITGGSCIAFFGSGMFVVTCPVLGRDLLGGASRGVLLLSGVAAGGLLANSVLARWPPSWRPEVTFAAATSAAAVAYLLAALAAGPGLLVASVVLLGAADGPQLTAIFAIRQRDAPERLRGQVLTTAASLKLTAGAIGALAGGALLGGGAGRALAVAAGTQAVAVIALLALGRARQADPGSPAPGPAA
jgi:MFS family permease